jgi:RNA polymerase sigma-70 factor (ECF subfamily)
MAVEMAHIFFTDAQELVSPARTEDADYFLALVSRARAGDELAFESIMLATEQRVVSIAWRMLGNRDDAREAAQDVYLRVFRYLDRFRAGDDFRAWLYRITVNVCHDFARKRRSHQVNQLNAIDIDQDVASYSLVDSAANPENRTLHSQQLELIRAALQSLPARERAALVLRDLEGFSTEEVAQTLGSRPVTVRSQISSARAKIKVYCDRLTGKGGRLR